MLKSVSYLLAPWNLAIVVIGLSVLFLWPTWASLHGYWLESTRYSHGHLIVVISGYLVYQLRGAFEKENARPSLLGLAPLSVSLFIWLIAVLGSIQAIHEIMLPIILWTLCLTVLGWHLAKRLILAIGYLYLAIPIWESGNFVLQWFTVKAVEIALRIFGIPAFIEGNFVFLPVGSFEIAGGCSGLHYFIVGLAISILYGALYLRSIQDRILLVGFAVVLALLTNWLRVFIVVSVGHITEMQHYLVIHNHYYFGWVLFVLAMIPFVFIGRRLERFGLSSAEPSLAETNVTASAGGGKVGAALGVCFLMLAACSGAIYAKMPGSERERVVIELPGAQGEWIRESSSDTDWRPIYVGTAAEALGRYRNDGDLVTVYVNLYRGQTQGHELIGYENHIEGRDKWNSAESRVRQIEMGENQFRPVRELILRSDEGARRVLYFWYYVGEQHLVSDLGTKLYYGYALLRGAPDAGVQILSARCQRDCVQARQVLQKWIQSYVPAKNTARISWIGEENDF